MQKNIVSFKKLKGKIIKNRKEKKWERKKGGKKKKKKSTIEWQKPNIEAEVYNNNKQCD